MRWRLWAGRRERLVLALLGVIVLGMGLSIIATLTDSIRGTVAKAYEQTWRAPYDILVHIPLENGAKLQDILEPNVLTTLPPGISMAQWKEISGLSGVQVAAPIAVVGYVPAGPFLAFPSQDTAPDPGKGIYRITTKVASTASGIPEEMTEATTVALVDRATGERPAGATSVAMTIDFKRAPAIAINTQVPTFLVGIDPEAENRLVGLDNALTHGQGLVSGETPHEIFYQSADPALPDRTSSGIPVLVNEQGLRDMSYTVTIQELDANGQVKRVVMERSWKGAELLGAIRQGQGQNNELLGQSGPVGYQQVPSPYPDRWPLALSLRQVPSDVRSSYLKEMPGHHVAIRLGPSFRTWGPPPHEKSWYQYKVKGYFDASKLSVVMDPRSQMPLMTYRPAEATRVLDPAGRPLNPPQKISGGISPVGFLSSPPVLLTNIEGALSLAGDKGINAIQVKVAGAEHFTPEAVAKVKQIAAEIEQRTGLVAEVTMGSSPTNVLINTGDSRGWLEEVWIHKNAAVTTVQQVEFGYSSYAALVLLVAGLYALATGLTGVTARRRELGVVIALGWPQGSLRWMVMAEQLLFALAAGLLAALAAAVAHALPSMVLGICGLALLIYAPAVIVSGQAAIRTAPGEALRWGDTAPGRRILPGSGVLPLALSSLMGRPGRTALTVLATALPTSLLVVLTFTSRYLQGVLFTTITGQYAALKVGPMQYASGLVALAIAAVTAFDLIRQNAADHRNERALLYALGWPRSWIAATMVAEGALLGLTAGLVGDLLGVAVLTILYGSAVAGGWLVALVVWLFPLVLGLLTGLVSSLVELRSWNRSGLAAVHASEVTRFGWGTRLVGALVALALMGGVATVTLSQLAAAWKAKAVSAGASPTEVAAAAIKAVVAQQDQALQSLDVNTYLSTLDPAQQPYVMEERHWLEDAQVWRQANPNGKMSLAVARISFLGTNTANVWVLRHMEGAKVPTTMLEEVWVQLADGHWVQHGYQHQVLQAGDVTVWYPPYMDQAKAQELLDQVPQAMSVVHKAGFAINGPLIVEIKEDADAFRASLGPNLASKGTSNVWSNYGEPLRLYTGGSTTARSLAAWLMPKMAAEATHNHAPVWFTEGVRYYGEMQVLSISLPEQVSRFGQVDLPAPLTFSNFPAVIDFSAPAYAQLSLSGLLFVSYLQEKYGPETLHRVLAILAQQPDDPRLYGPITEPERNQLTINAIEQVTGAKWADLSKQYMTWLQAKHFGR